MDVSADEMRDRLRYAITLGGTDAATLARYIGRGADYFRDFLIGRKNSVSSTALNQAELFLGLEYGDLTRYDKVQLTRVMQHDVVEVYKKTFRESREKLTEIHEQQSKKRGLIRNAFLDDIPIYSSIEENPGELLISTDPVQLVARPWYLGSVTVGYGVVIIGESMVPLYEPGDIIVVNPRLPAVRGKNAIFTADPVKGHSAFKATVRRLERAAEAEWHVRQWNPAEGEESCFSLTRATWPNAFRIVGKYEP